VSPGDEPPYREAFFGDYWIISFRVDELLSGLPLNVRRTGQAAGRPGWRAFGSRQT
jgi:hypothetical protein